MSPARATPNRSAEATSSSDVDLVILCKAPDDRLAGNWPPTFGQVELRAIEDYGALRSFRVSYREVLEVEFGVAAPSWANVPLDSGTRIVLLDGVRILHDPGKLLEAAKRAAVA